MILVDAGAMTLAESVGAIRRGKQTVAFGDPITQTPSRVRDRDQRPGARGASRTASLDDVHADSVLARLGTLLPTLALTRSYRAGGEDLAELVNRRFYAGKIESFPWAGSFLGHGSIRLDYVEDGFGMPDQESGAVESVDAEVDRVVELVLEHASTPPERVAHGDHGERTARACGSQQAVLAALATRPLLHDFILGDRAEPFTVTTIERAVAQSRDRVIFSIGFGRTPHGRVLSDFGALGKPGGERLLAVAMTCARRAHGHRHLLQAGGPRRRPDAPRRARAGRHPRATSTPASAADAVPDDSDPMLVDLARRLQARGLQGRARAPRASWAWSPRSGASASPSKPTWCCTA